MESTHLGVGFLLRCFQQLSAPYLATQRILLAQELVYQWCVLPGPLVLWEAPLNALPPAPDMDRTVSMYLHIIRILLLHSSYDVEDPQSLVAFPLLPEA